MIFFYHLIFVTQFSSIDFHHWSFITLKYHTRLTPLLTCHHSIFFTLFVGFKAVTRCSFFFPSTQTHWTQWKKKKKLKTETSEKRRRRRKRRKEKKRKTPDQEKKGKKEEKEDTWDRTQEKKGKKKVDWSKGAAELWLMGPYVCLITKMSFSYELWKLKTLKMCFYFP